MNRKVLLVATHTFGCLTFLALPYIFAEDGFSKLSELAYNPHEQRNLFSYLLTIAFFYLNYYVLIPQYFFARNYILYVFCLLSCFIIIEQTLVRINRRTSTPLAIAPPPPPGSTGSGPGFGPPDRPPLPPPGSFPKPQSQQPGLPPEISQTFLLFSIGLLLSLAIRVNNRWRETEREKLNTELSYLKAQINPHFLFNTLNSIYSLAIEQSDRTAEAITRLSALMRYVIQDTAVKQVPLSKEFDYISHYVALQQLRLDDTVRVDFSINGKANGQQISPLILISFIENAFKYGVNPSEDSSIRIKLSIQGNELHCHVFNKKVRVAQEAVTTSGIGLTNTKARLALVYPNQHRLLITDQPSDFTVDLYLTLP
ncbi:sensor histidine kinase [Spirosoma oryzicola]|uniref:sensor histidine kinase n=1 Tax=Spirosoma oryzicola TaxID=2898794 RepID=UPI001E5654DF|nr:sensor histidine kinase [Spirosoma oryzicola]UHG90986.1 sensor histidine kinase [Spirosoma oryzicola]